MVSYDYYEVVIDSAGKVVTYLSEKPTHINLSANVIKKSPTIYTKFISDTMLAVMNSQKKWSVIMLPSK